MKKFCQDLINKHPKLWEITKFLRVGGLATIIDFLAMAITMYLMASKTYDNNFLNVLFKSEQYKELIPGYLPIIGTGVGFLFGLVFNYLFSIIFVFKETKFAKTTKGMLLFTILAIIGLLIHLVGMWVGTELLPLNYWLVKIVLTIVVLIFNYISRKKLVFNSESNEHSSNSATFGS